MERSTYKLWHARLIAYIVMAFGLITIASALERQLQVREHRPLHELLLTLPVLAGISYIYLGTLLLRLKYNAWLTALVLSVLVFVLNLATAADRYTDAHRWPVMADTLHLALPILIFLTLLVSREVFRVRSDRLGFRQAVRVSVLVLAVTFVYGVLGFILLDTHDFHQEISLAAAAHQTIDQLGVTTRTVVPYTARARLFVDSLTVLSIGALVYAALAFFQPIRLRLRPQENERRLAEVLLHRYPSDIDDFFKLWPHDKQYFFDHEQESGLAYHVTRGVALVVGDPFGDPRRFLKLVQAFQVLCFVNDWRPAFIHVGERHKVLYEKLGFRLQKLGEEAVLDLEVFKERERGKYFRQIRSRFTKLGYSVELLESPHDAVVLNRLQAISMAWLELPGRAERGLMMGYYSAEYMQLSRVAVVRDGEGQIHGFMNIVPTFEDGMANYDLLRCDADAPGNCNDFLLLEVASLFREQGYTTLNLGLCPLKGLDEGSESVSIVDAALRFIYANGDRLYSFSGLERFKAKYHPAWEDRYVAYIGGAPQFARIMTTLTRAMKIK